MVALKERIRRTNFQRGLDEMLTLKFKGLNQANILRGERGDILYDGNKESISLNQWFSTVGRWLPTKQNKTQFGKL
jgi:hypothetical protein